MRAVIQRVSRASVEIEGNVKGKIGLGLLVLLGIEDAQSKKGNRPSFIRASKPDVAIPTYENFCVELSSCIGKPIETGIFGADMKVNLLNDGPVTIWIDTKNKE